MRAPPVPSQIFPVFRRVAHGEGDALSFEKSAGKVIGIAAVFRVSDLQSAFPSMAFPDLHDPRRLRAAAGRERQSQRDDILGVYALRDQTLSHVIARIEFP